MRLTRRLHVWRLAVVSVMVCIAIFTMLSTYGVRPVSYVVNYARGHANGFTGIILLTIQRSGSSFTGDLLQQHDDAFYVYEPLHSLQYTREVSFLDDPYRVIYSYNTTEIQYQALLGWLTCDFSKIYLRSLEDDDFLNYGKKTKTFVTCKRQSISAEYGTYKRQFYDCVEQLRETCLKSKYRIIKTVRASMTLVVDLLDKIGSVKVINLVRDPRASLHSRRKLCAKNSACLFFETARKVCAPLEEAISVKEKLLRKYPVAFNNFLITLKYEELLYLPITQAHWLYKFLGIPFTADVRDYIINASMPGGPPAVCEVCQLPWQQGEAPVSDWRHVMAWRGQIAQAEVGQIEQQCSRALKYYNYTSEF